MTRRFNLFSDDVEIRETATTAEDLMHNRISLINEKCRQDSDPFRPEYSSLTSPPQSLGVEVVYLHGGRQTPEAALNVASVCIPHKVGSYSWGQFARNLSEVSQASASNWRNLDWRGRAERSLKVVVVRHPLTR